MKKRDPEILVDDIAKSIAAIRDYTLDLSKKEFNGDKKTQDAVFKRIENMGEAVKICHMISAGNIRIFPGKKLRE